MRFCFFADLRVKRSTIQLPDANSEFLRADYIVHALGVVARAQNMSKLARNAGMSREGLYKALSETGNPSFSTVVKVAAALGLRISFTAYNAQESVHAG